MGKGINIFIFLVLASCTSNKNMNFFDPIQIVSNQIIKQVKAKDGD